MAFVGGLFHHDIFVTYSHGHVEPGAESMLKRWSQAFARQLEAELKTDRAFSQSLNMFLDEDHRPDQGIDPGEPLGDQLKHAISRSGLLIVLMSDHYLASDWCRRERDWWMAAAQSDPMNAAHKIGIVRAWPTETAWPPALLGGDKEELPGFPFYDHEKRRPFGWPVPMATTEGPFRDKFLQVAGWASDALKKLRAEREEHDRRQADIARITGRGDRRLIYLYGRCEDIDSWQQAGQALKAQGYSVLPSEPDPIPDDPDELHRISKARIRALTGCDAMLLLGSVNGRELDADIATVGRIERHSARARSDKLLPCAVLDTKGSSSIELRRSSARELGIDWIEAHRRPWAPEIGEWLVKASAMA